MDIPNLNPVQTGSGGPLVTSMRGINALIGDYQDLKHKQLVNDWYGQTAYANALSKMAYSNLMGPQFLAKLMTNPAWLGNRSQSEIINALNAVTNAGMGIPNNNGLGMPNNNANGILNNNGNPMPNNNNSHSNAFMGMPNNNAAGGFNPPAQDQSANNPYYMGLETSGSETPSSKNKLATPVGLDKPPPTVNGLIPIVIPPGTKRSYPSADERPQGTVAENAGNYEGTVEERKKSGEIRAQDIHDLDTEYDKGAKEQITIDSLIHQTNDPVFKNMRSKIPFFQDKQLSVLSKAGTPQEQEAIGQFIGTTKRLQANTIQSFGSRVLATEFPFTDAMKISDNDTWNTMVGKLKATNYYNLYTMKRARVAASIMEKQHLSKGDAMEIADHQLDGGKIREQSEDMITPMWNIKNTDPNDKEHYGEIITLPASEARKKIAESKRKKAG